MSPLSAPAATKRLQTSFSNSSAVGACEETGSLVSPAGEPTPSKVITREKAAAQSWQNFLAAVSGASLMLSLPVARIRGEAVLSSWRGDESGRPCESAKRVI